MKNNNKKSIQTRNDPEKSKKIIERAVNGENTTLIAKDLEVSKDFVFSTMKENGIMTRRKVVLLIKEGYSNEEIQEESKWNIGAINNLRYELANKKEKDEDEFRILLAKGVRYDEIARRLGYTSKNSIETKRSRLNVLNREEIIELFDANLDDTEIAARAKIEDVKVITEIREEEMARRKQEAKERQEEMEINARIAKEREKAKAEREQQFRIAIAKGVSVKEVASQFGFTINTVYTKKSVMGLLGRKAIIALLPYKTDEEIASLAGLSEENIYVIKQIREDERAKKAKEVAKKNEEKKAKSTERNQDTKKNKKDKEKASEKLANQSSNMRRKVRSPKKAKREIEKTLIEKGEIKYESMKVSNASQVPEKTELPLLTIRTEEEFIKLAGNLTNIKIIAEKLNLQESEIEAMLCDYNIFTRDEVVEWLDSKSDIQIALMGNLKDYIIVSKVRQEEAQRDEKTGENEEENTQEKMQAQRLREERQFFRMARNYEPVKKMESVFGVDRYKIILKLRKLGLRTRDEIERLIENSNMLDDEIVGENGNINAVKRIRRIVNQREKLINSVPLEKRGKIISKLSSNLDVRFIADTMRVSPEAIKAMQEKWKRDKEQMTTEQKRKNLKVEITQFEIKARTIGKESSENSKKALKYMINKMLVIYEGALEPIHYACFTYAYMKTGEYLQAIEFAEEHLNLQNSSSSGVIDKINEVLESEKEKGENLNTSRNIREELMAFVEKGE